MLNTFLFVHRVVIATILCAAFVVRVDAETLTQSSVRLPDSILISPDLRPHIDAMLEGSPTFRQQFDRIVTTPKLIITARFDPTFQERGFKARSCMRRYDTGLLMVSMDIGVSPSPVEWIAHEFEHVLEQLDGVPLKGLVDRWRSGVWFSGSEMVETWRAMRAGQVVRREMQTLKQRSDKFVQ